MMSDPSRTLFGICICTHNRSTDVSVTLSALAPQIAAMDGPVVIVDSASSAANVDVLLQLAEQFGVRIIRSDTPGLSLARNIGADAIDADWIVYLDDDATVHPDYIANLTEVLNAAPDDVAVVGGRIAPAYPDGVGSDHITERWRLLLSCTDADGAGDVGGGQFNVCGANLAIRRAALAQVGGFPTTLGRTGEHLISGEESFVLERLEDLHLRARYDSRFAVDHRIPAERLNLAWAKKRAFWEGASRIQIAHELGKPIPANMGVAKLAVSIPILYGLALIGKNQDYAIRYSRAMGSLYWRMKGAQRRTGATS